jgi:hypothetical protein
MNQKTNREKIVSDAIQDAIRDLLRDVEINSKNKKYTRESMRWLAKQARSIKIGTSEFLMSQDKDRMRNKTQIHPGGMYVFSYDPKYKKTLPYYDRFPCIFLFNIPDSQHMLGINLHYLNYTMRLKLMEELYKTQNNAKLNKNKRLEISWQILKMFSNFNLVKPCVKMYLFSHLKSKLIKIPYEEWPVVAMLPIQDFSKASTTKVWSESRKKAMG